MVKALTAQLLAYVMMALTVGCQLSRAPEETESVSKPVTANSRVPASISNVRRPAIEDPTGSEMSGYSTLENCGILVPDAPDVPAAAKKDPNWCKSHPKYQSIYASARAGQEIWVKATAGNARFNIYNYEQKVGVQIDWWKFLRTDERYRDRFAKFGFMNDPDCCSPNQPGDCESKFNRHITMDETHGFDYCPGDATLNRYVGNRNEKYQDPACRLQESNSDQLRRYPLEKSACNLEFGTSTGVVGFRKFPNPRFDADEWNRRSQGKGYEGISELKISNDHSIEPPYRIGMACAACHIGFNPVQSPGSFEAMKRPEWLNMLANVGNPYARVSEVMATGMGKNSVEWQSFTHARPGTVDTSAQPNDFVNNPGTFNAIYNLGQRPKFNHQVRNTYHRETGKYDDAPVSREVYHILKGGEDSIGPEGAVQRVYINIGSCSEECWTNHLTDLHELDPAQRGYGQTPFNMRQCQRDCGSYRAVEARVFDVFNFFLTARPSDLKDAVANGSEQQLVSKIETNQLIANPPPTLQFRTGDVERGRQVYAQQCARCHSSQSPDAAGNLSYGHASNQLFQSQVSADQNFFSNLRFTDVLADKPSLRVDFLSNDKLVEIKEVGTYTCRALHSNHMAGHVYQDYGSDTYRQARHSTSLKNPVGLNAGVPGYLRTNDSSGPGYLRNTSLISVWATAPYFHNNALGPELVAPKFENPANNLFVDPYEKKGVKENYAATNPSVAGRLDLFARSIDQLLMPENQRPAKVSRTAEPVEIDLSPEFANSLLLPFLPKIPTLRLVIPKGIPVVLLGSLRHKELVADLYSLIKSGHVNAGSVLEKSATLMGGLLKALRQPGPIKRIQFSQPDLERLLVTYGNCIPLDHNSKPSYVENLGHEFGAGRLEDSDKQALKAFLLTL